MASASAPSGRTTYRPDRLVIAVAGDLDHEDAVRLATSGLGIEASDGVAPPEAPGRPREWLPAPPAPCTRLAVERRRTAQAHLCLGLPALPRDHPDQWALELLSAVLGDGSSSRLFLSVREEAGLAYDVHSFQTEYQDAGVLGVYAGVDPDDLARALTAILAELARIRDERVPGGRAGEGARLCQRAPRAASRGHPPHVLLAGLAGGAPRPGPDARRGAAAPSPR